MASCKAGLLFPSLKGLRGIQLGNVCSKSSGQRFHFSLALNPSQSRHIEQFHVQDTKYSSQDTEDGRKESHHSSYLIPELK